MTTNYVELANKIALDKRSKKASLDTLEGGGRGHLGAVLSLLEITRASYDSVLNHNPANPLIVSRDRFVLSMGYGYLDLFTVLAGHGYFPTSELGGNCGFESNLRGNLERATLPGLEFSTGALRQGLSVGVGMAMTYRLNKELQILDLPS